MSDFDAVASARERAERLGLAEEVERLTADNRRLIAERDMAEKKIVQLSDKCAMLWRHIPDNVRKLMPEVE